MSISVIKALSLLVASGNGDRCDQFRVNLRQTLLIQDEQTDKSKIEIFKNRESPDYGRIGKEVYDAVVPLLKGIAEHYYGPDKMNKSNDRN